MTFDEFKQEVMDKIKDFLPINYQDATVEIRDVIKNNDTHLSGLTIRNEESGIAPTLYLEDFYNAVESGEHSFNGIMTRMAETYMNAAEADIAKDAKDVVNQITDYDATKDKIVPRIVNRESNEERLQDMPHTDMGDLAITYHVDLGSADDGQMSVAINNQMMERYGVKVSDLHEAACANMENITPTTFKTMGETLAEIMVPGYADMSAEQKEEVMADMGLDDPGMYVLSNESKTFGAAALLDTKTMDSIRDSVGDFYILPSSVHEVLIVPKRDDLDLATLENMVQEVNATQVAPNEVLSDHVFEYDPETKEVFRADQAAEHQQQKDAAREAKATVKEAKEETKEAKSDKKERPSLKAKLEEKKAESKALDKEHKEKDKERSLEQENGKKGAR